MDRDGRRKLADELQLKLQLGGHERRHGRLVRDRVGGRRYRGLVAFWRQGRVVFYRLADGFPHQLLEQRLRELLTIATKETS